MCFYAKCNTPGRATKDIICYKVVERIYTPQKGFRGPFYPFRYLPNIEYKADDFRRDLNSNVLAPVTKGGFYTFKSIKSAEKLKENISRFYLHPHYPRLMIVECVIPKGSLYYTSIHDINGYGTEYCSKKLKIVARFSRGKRVEE